MPASHVLFSGTKEEMSITQSRELCENEKRVSHCAVVTRRRSARPTRRDPLDGDPRIISRTSERISAAICTITSNNDTTHRQVLGEEGVTRIWSRRM